MRRYFQGLGDDSEDEECDIWIREIDFIILCNNILNIVKHSHHLGVHKLKEIAEQVSYVMLTKFSYIGVWLGICRFLLLYLIGLQLGILYGFY